MQDSSATQDAPTLGNNELKIEQFYFIPVGNTLEGDQVVDPSFSPLPEGPLGVPTLPSPTPQKKMEEGEIPVPP